MWSFSLHNHRKQAPSVQGVCKKQAGLGSRKHAKSISKNSLLNFCTKTSAADGQQWAGQRSRAGADLALLTSPRECICTWRWVLSILFLNPLLLRSQKNSSRNKLGCSERAGKRGNVVIIRSRSSCLPGPLPSLLLQRLTEASRQPWYQLKPSATLIWKKT